MDSSAALRRRGQALGSVLFAAGLVLPSTTLAPLPQIIPGTEGQPEPWGHGTVKYDPAYPFAKDHDYLAINRSWFDVDGSEAHLVTHLRVVSTERLAANEKSGEIHCVVSANLPDQSGSGARP